jgi:MFS family permease
MSSYSILLPVYLQQLGGSYLDVGLLGTASGIPYIILPLIVGILCDRFGRKIFFHLGLLMAMVNAFLLMLTQAVYEVILIRAISSIAYAFFLPSSTAIVSDFSGVVERVRALGYLNFSWALGMLIGPLFGGLIVEKYDFTILFLISIFIGAASFIPVLFRPIEMDRRLPEPSKTLIKTHDEKWSALYPVFLIIFIVSIVLSMAFNLFPAYLNNLNFSTSYIGGLFAIFGLTRALTFTQVSRITRIGDNISVIIGILCVSLATFAIFVSISLYPYIIIMIVLGFGLGILIPLSKAIASKVVKRKNLGSAIGATESVFGVGWTLSPFLGGLMAYSALGQASPYLMCSILSLITLAPVILLMRKYS